MSNFFLNLEYFFNGLLNLIKNIITYFSDTAHMNMVYNILALIAILFLSVIAYCAIRLIEIRKREHAHLHEEIHEYAIHKAEREKSDSSAQGGRNLRWQNVLKYLASDNQDEWKLAIMEADSMLENLTDILELEGISVGEKLKSTNKDRFKSLDDAWEAHIVRNKIAHGGLQFELTKREAQRVIYLYEKVFREFGHI